MTKKRKHKQTKAEIEAGQRNLQTWLEGHPERGNLRHGAFSESVRARYSDLRTRQGKQLQAIRDAIIEDLGGPQALSAGHLLLLDNLKSVLIVILQMSAYVDQQESIFKGDELIPVLRQSFLQYIKNARHLVESLYGFRKPEKRAATLEDYLKGKKQ